MIWIENIQDLEYYRRSASDYCYCELLLKPTDICLQGSIGTGGLAGNAMVSFHAYSAGWPHRPRRHYRVLQLVHRRKSGA